MSKDHCEECLCDCMVLFQGATACQLLSSLLAGASIIRRSLTISCVRDAAVLILAPAEMR